MSRIRNTRLLPPPLKPEPGTGAIPRTPRRSAALLALSLATLMACGRADPPAGQPAPSGRVATMTAQGDVLTREQIVQINASRMTDLFEGNFAGVQVVPLNGRPTLMIRGQRDPLIEVDGVPLADPQSLWSLYPRQIEEIWILKGEQTARYGLRGARGVVLVTTRDQ